MFVLNRVALIEVSIENMWGEDSSKKFYPQRGKIFLA
jgi:hypothetical protein